MKVALYVRVSTSDRDQNLETQLLPLRGFVAPQNRKVIGKPKVTIRPSFPRRFRATLERLTAGEISRPQAAKELGIGYATLKRLLEAQPNHPRPEAV
jgi:DNA invertase Pin-like site-specific DNA recombinase